MDLVSSEVHFAPDPPVGPSGMDVEAMAEQAHGSTVIGPSKIIQFTAGKRPFFFPVPTRRKAVASRSCLDTRSQAAAMCLDVATRSELEISQRVVVEAVPDFACQRALKLSMAA